MLYRSPLRAFTAIVFGTASLAVVGLTAAAPAGATSGPVALDSGPSGQANEVSLYGASSAGILYAITNITGNVGQFYMRPTGGSSTPVPAGVFPSIVAPAIVGSMIGGFDGASTYTWTTVTGSASGTSTVPAGVTFQTVSFDGYLYSAIPSGMTATHIYDVNVTTHTTTDLGAVPGNPGRIVLTPSTNGVLIETFTTPTVVPESLYYVAYATPTHLTTLASPAPVQGAPVLGTDTAAWIENPTVSTDESTFVLADTTVVRVGLDGSAEVRTDPLCSERGPHVDAHRHQHPAAAEHPSNVRDDASRGRHSDRVPDAANVDCVDERKFLRRESTRHASHGRAVHDAIGGRSDHPDRCGGRAESQSDRDRAVARSRNVGRQRYWRWYVEPPAVDVWVNDHAWHCQHHLLGIRPIDLQSALGVGFANCLHGEHSYR